MKPTSGSIASGTFVPFGNENWKRWINAAKNRNTSVSAKTFPGQLLFPIPNGINFSSGWNLPLSSKNLQMKVTQIERIPLIDNTYLSEIVQWLAHLNNKLSYLSGRNSVGFSKYSGSLIISCKAPVKIVPFGITHFTPLGSSSVGPPMVISAYKQIKSV